MIDLWMLENSIEIYFDVNLLDASRKQNVVYAKRLFCKIARDVSKYTFHELAKFLKCHHATIIHHYYNFDAVFDRHKDFYNRFMKTNDIDLKVEVKSKKNNFKYVLKEDEGFLLEPEKKDVINKIAYKLNDLELNQINNFIETRLNPYLKMNQL